MIYSLDKINEMAEGDQDFINSVISVFLEEVPEDLEALEVALQEKNYDQVYKLAHKIKPNGVYQADIMHAGGGHSSSCW